MVEQVWLKHNAASDAYQRGGRRPKGRKKSLIFKFFLPCLKMWISVSSLLLSSSWTYVVVQSLSHVWLFVTQQTAVSQAPTCPSLSPRVYSGCCLSHPLLPPSPFAVSLSQHKGLPRNQLFASGGWSVGTSASVSVLLMNIQGWSLLELTGLISLQSKGLSRVFSKATVQNHQFFRVQLCL